MTPKLPQVPLVGGRFLSSLYPGNVSNSGEGVSLLQLDHALTIPTPNSESVVSETKPNVGKDAAEYPGIFFKVMELTPGSPDLEPTLYPLPAKIASLGIRPDDWNQLCQVNLSYLIESASSKPFRRSYSKLGEETIQCCRAPGNDCIHRHLPILVPMNDFYLTF